jgi:cytochrome b561
MGGQSWPLQSRDDRRSLAHCAADVLHHPDRPYDDSHVAPGPAREMWFTIHKSIGITILVLVVLRVIVRAVGRTPDYPGTMGRLEHAAASAVQILLYFVMAWMCVSGYVTSLAGGHGFDWFFLFPTPDLVPRSRALAHIASVMHIVGQWVVYTLIAAHVLGAAFHLIVRRDGVFQRMLP